MIAAVALLGLYINFSRLFVCDHFLTDIIAGTAKGTRTVWVTSSTDDGVTWEHVTQGLPVADAREVEVHPSGDVFASYLNAIYRSQDGGTTWSPPRRLAAQPISTNWLPRAEGGRMVGDYFSVSYAGNRVVPVFALATSPLAGRFREAIFATSLPLGG